MFMFRKGVAPAMPGHVQNLSRIWEELLPLAVKKIRYKKESYFSFPDTEANTFGYIKSGHTGTIHPLFDGQEHIKFHCRVLQFLPTSSLPDRCRDIPVQRRYAG